MTPFFSVPPKKDVTLRPHEKLLFFYTEDHRVLIISLLLHRYSKVPCLANRKVCVTLFFGTFAHLRIIMVFELLLSTIGLTF
jgi:hypothetical protein